MLKSLYLITTAAVALALAPQAFAGECPAGKTMANAMNPKMHWATSSLRCLDRTRAVSTNIATCSLPRVARL